MLDIIFLIVPVVLYLLAIWMYEVEHKKLRGELKAKINQVHYEENRLHQKVLHAEYHFKQMEQIEREMKEELEATKTNRQFLNSAIRGKLQKTKRQPKRRKRAS